MNFKNSFFVKTAIKADCAIPQTSEQNMVVNPGDSIQVLFSTKTEYPLPEQRFMLPVNWKRYHLSQLINTALGLSQPIPFDFLVHSQILRGSLEDWCNENDIGTVC